MNPDQLHARARIYLVHVGLGHYVAGSRVVDVESPTKAPIQRLIREGKTRGLILDLTSGRKTKSVLFLDTGHIVLSALQPGTYRAREAEAVVNA